MIRRQFGLRETVSGWLRGAPEAADKSAAAAPEKKGDKSQEVSGLGKLGRMGMDALKGKEQKELEQRLKDRQWDFDTFRLQLLAQKSAGSRAQKLKYMPGAGQFRDQLEMASEAAEDPVEQAKLETFLNLIDNMTPQQKKNPGTFSRNSGLGKVQLAKKCGASGTDVQMLLDQYVQLSIIFKHMFALQEKGVVLPDQYDDMMQVIMQKAKFTPKEMAILAKAAKEQGLGSADQATRMTNDPRMNRVLKRKAA